MTCESDRIYLDLDRLRKEWRKPVPKTRVRRLDWCSCVTMQYPKCKLCDENGKMAFTDWQASALAAEKRVRALERKLREMRKAAKHGAA